MRISDKGMTLIELLVAVFIVAILASIAIPTYTSYIKRGRRADAKTALQHVRAAQEMWRAEKGSYATDAGGTAETKLQTTMGAPATALSSYYDWSFTVKTGAAFTAQATAKGSQLSDGNLTIDQDGVTLPADKWAK